MTIFEDVGEAIIQAKGLAKLHCVAWTVWRCGDRFTARPESTKGADVWPGAAYPIRPVATYDPDGTEYC